MPAVTGRCFNGHHTSTLTRVVFQQEAPRGYSPPFLSALHHAAALFAGIRGVLVLIYARMIQFLHYHIMFSPFVNQKAVKSFRGISSHERPERSAPHPPDFNRAAGPL